MKVCGKCNVLCDLNAAEKVLQWIVDWCNEPCDKIYDDPLFVVVMKVYGNMRIDKKWNDSFQSLKD